MEIFGIDFGCAYGSLVNGQIPEKDCMLPLLSKILGYCIVAASTTVKLPQILKILKHGSVRGPSAVSCELEFVGYTIVLAYSLHKRMPFSAYGELLFLFIQAIILVAVIYYHSQPMGAMTWIRPLLYASQHAIFFIARIPQIRKNFRNISTGELSFLTFFMNFAGGSVGVFTRIQEKTPTGCILTYIRYLAANYFLWSSVLTGLTAIVSVFTNLDSKIVLIGSILGVILNGTLLSQILIYQTPPTKDEKKTN